YSEFLKGRIGHGLASDSVIDILVSPTLLPPNSAGKKDRIHAQVGGCARGSAWREVDPAPDIPPLFADTPLAQDRSVFVHNLVPGCLVDVNIEETWANEIWTASIDAHVPVPSPLQQGQHVDVTARLCRQQRSAPTVTVAAPLVVKWTQPSGMGI